MDRATAARKGGKQLVETEWGERLRRVLHQPELLTPRYQPIIDTLRGTVAGFEMLSRFALPGGERPIEWFSAAVKLGVIERLDALVLSRAIREIPALPANTFLTVNVTTRGAVSPEVLSVLESTPAIRPLVIELTELTETDDPDRLADFVDAVRGRQGLIAVDDIGTGYSSLQRILSIRPEFVKIDHSFVSRLHEDEAKVAAIEMIGGLADRIDGWVIAEGVECLPELDRLVRLRVPLAQGRLFAGPQPTMLSKIGDGASFRREDLLDIAESELLSLVDEEDAVREDAPRGTVAQMFAAEADLKWVMVTDLFDRPRTLVKRRGSGELEEVSVMRVHPGATIQQIARRAMARDVRERFDPIAMCGGQGRYVGTIRLERIIDVLSGDRPSEINSP